MRGKKRVLGCVAAVVLMACGAAEPGSPTTGEDIPGVGGSGGPGGADDAWEPDGGPDETSTSSGSDESEASTDGTDSGGIDDSSGSDGGAEVDVCAVMAGTLDGLATCHDGPTPFDGISAFVQEWEAPGASMVIPLVANLTDDNGDGAVDLCDTPDVVYTRMDTYTGTMSATVQVLDGATGDVHHVVTEDAHPAVTPALADIDDDGQIEIVTLVRAGLGTGLHLAAFGEEGTLQWASAHEIATNQLSNGEGMFLNHISPLTVAIHDLDASGSPEIMVGRHVYDAVGDLLWSAPPAPELEEEGFVGAFALDVNDDGEMEVLLGNAVYSAAGELLAATGVPAGVRSLPHVADFNLDGAADYLLSTDAGVVYGSAGAPFWDPVTPAAPNDVSANPIAIADLTGDGAPDYVVPTADAIGVWQADAPPFASAAVTAPGRLGATAFDFWGDGAPETVFASSEYLRIDLDVMQTGTHVGIGRNVSASRVEYPIVADVDGDGSAELLVSGAEEERGLRVFGAQSGSFLQARRIWNQHAYYVTNIAEDGTVPQHVVPPWEGDNTFRVNSALWPGERCLPRS
ncbi:MAG: VCBS repeat-containing protein [Myxococcota bacterium]